MSFEVQGNNNLTGIPLLNTEIDSWSSTIEQCDPLFQHIARVGLSAFSHGIKESPATEEAMDIITSQEVFNEEGMFVNKALYRVLGVGRYPREEYADHISAGICIIEGVFIASRMFRELPVIIKDYEGQTGLNRLERRVELAVPENMARKIGPTLNTYTVNGLEARVSTFAGDTDSSIALTFAAASPNVPTLPRSISTTLISRIERRSQTVRAKLSSAYREGNFVVANTYSDFDELHTYASAVSATLSNT